jgi:hypothetical protein
MSSAPNEGKPFQIGFSGAMAEVLRQLQRQASREGRGAAFLGALRTAVERLQNDPKSFGEPLYRLPALRMDIRCAVVRPLSGHFGICEDQPLVMIQAVKLLSTQES